MKNTTMHVCANTSFVGRPSTGSRRVSSACNFLSFSRYFRKYFKLVYIKNVLMVTLATSIMFLLFSCMHFCVWGILRRQSACAPTAYKVFLDYRNLRNTALGPFIIGPIQCTSCDSMLKGLIIFMVRDISSVSNVIFVSDFMVIPKNFDF
jgi:hypothetical protein